MALAARLPGVRRAPCTADVVVERPRRSDAPAKTIEQIGFVDEPPNLPAQIFGVAWCEEQSVDVVPNQLGNTAEARRDDGDAGAERLVDHERAVLFRD